MGTAPVNSLVFSKYSEFIFAGMADGIVKAWNLQK
jgi:WD40 repeat protein